MEVTKRLNDLVSEQLYIVGKGHYEDIYKIVDIVYDSPNDIILVNYRKFQVMPGQYTFYYSDIRTNEFIYHVDQGQSFIMNDQIDWTSIDAENLDLSSLVIED